MKQKPTECIFTVDVEPDWAGLGKGRETYFGLRSLHKLSSVLKRLGIKGTFFVTGDAANASTNDMSELYGRGHEIANHGMDHRRLTGLNPTEVRENVREGQRCIREIIGVDPVGFRCPYGMVNGQILVELARQGYLYDSSMIPTPWHLTHLKSALGSIPTAPRRPHKVVLAEGLSIFELPISVSEPLRLPLGSYWMQLLGYRVFMWLFERADWQMPLIAYSHSWTVAGISRGASVSPIVDRIGYRNRGNAEFDMLCRFLRYLARAGVVFLTCRDALNSMGSNWPSHRASDCGIDLAFSEPVN